MREQPQERIYALLLTSAKVGWACTVYVVHNNTSCHKKQESWSRKDLFNFQYSRVGHLQMKRNKVKSKTRLRFAGK